MHRRRFSFALATLTLSAEALCGTQYFVSPTGSDAADGLTPQTAWKTASKVDTTSFAPGSEILFQRGGEWRERLVASSSGTANSPITYGAYGAGAKPKFWGSDVLNTAAFTPVELTTAYTLDMSASTFVGSVFENQQFLRSAAILSPNDPIGYVKANPNTWYYYDAIDRLYVNTGGALPSGPGQLTAAVRDDVVDSNGKNNLVFKDLVVDETARSDRGYAFRIQNSDNVRVEDSEAYRAGKHHFGVINTDNFVAKNLYSAVAMPDQVYGGSTAYVAFSSNVRTGDDSTWIDCVAENMGGPYSAFYTHGEGVGNILVKNLTARGTIGMAIATEGTNQDIRIEGGTIENGSITLYGHGVTVDGMKMTGAGSLVDIRGNDNTIQNMLINGAKPNFGYFGAITDMGTGNVVQFNTVVLDPSSPAHTAAFSAISASTNTKLFGNIFISPSAVRTWFNEFPQLQSDYNLFSPDSQILLNNGIVCTLSQWQSAGFDLNTIVGIAAFVDPATGQFTLAPGSAGIDGLPVGLLNGLPGWDYLGNDRPTGFGYDLGAFEAVPEPSQITLLALAAAGVVRRRRRRTGN